MKALKFSLIKQFCQHSAFNSFHIAISLCAPHNLGNVLGVVLLRARYTYASREYIFFLLCSLEPG